MTPLGELLAAAVAYHQRGQLQEAERIYRRVLDANPQHAETWRRLGVVSHQCGEHAAAEAHLSRAIALAPEVATYHDDLGKILRAAGRPLEAAAAYRRALELAPVSPAVWNNLGNAHKDQGQFGEALSCYAQALALDPAYPEAMNNLANTLRALSRATEAATWYEEALRRQPDFAPAHYNLGTLLQGQGRTEEAIACYRRALALQPQLVDVYASLGYALREEGRLQEMLECFQEAVRQCPSSASSHNNLGYALRFFARQADVENCYRRSVALAPQSPCYYSNLLLAMECSGSAGPAGLRAAYEGFDRQYAEQLRPAWRSHANLHDANKTLHLGFVSADFRIHPTAYSFLRPLECLRAEDCRITCYSNRLRTDELTQRFRVAAHGWRDIAGWDDDRVAAQIRADGIDVLIDLCGHFSDNRLLVFARRPAPVQVSWVGPTGLAAMDYIIVDPHQAPRGSQQHYRERLLMLPECYTAFEPPPGAPDVCALPAMGSGQITLGTLNHLMKITPRVIECWAEILRRLPAARLVIRHIGTAGSGEDLQPLRSAFEAHGVAPRRIELVGRAPHAQRLDLYHRIDLALDTFPFAGGITTCEALWMGVPVVTCPGETYFSRLAVTHLHHAGLHDLITADLGEYVDRVVRLAGDLPRLAELRAGLRQRLIDSPLYDAPRLAKELLGALRAAWREWTGT